MAKLTVQSDRNGFTLLELLIIISIIGILLAMLIPATRTTREAARRSLCMNNIRQLALSLHNYESSHGCLPPAAGIAPFDKSNLPSNTKQYSGFLSTFWFMQRYRGPYYDTEYKTEDTIYPAYPNVDSAGYPLWTEQRPAFICPSAVITETGFATTSYAFCIGDTARNIHNPTAIRGAFAVGLNQTLADITDGLSQTIVHAEIGGPQESSPGRRFAINQPKRYLDRPASVHELIDNKEYAKSVTLSKKLRGGHWADGTGGPGLVNTILPPGSPSLLIDGEREMDGYFSAGVNHPGGTIVAMGDGSGHFINRDIDVGDQERPTSSAADLVGNPSPYGVWGAYGSANGNDSTDEL